MAVAHYAVAAKMHLETFNSFAEYLLKRLKIPVLFWLLIIFVTKPPFLHYELLTIKDLTHVMPDLIRHPAPAGMQGIV